jgi:hypothetical protein
MSGQKVPVNFSEDWGTSVWAQALHRHTNYILFISPPAISGPGCETQLLEVARRAVGIPINGANVHICRQGRAHMNASQSPLEQEWAFEVASAVMHNGLNRQTAGELVRKIGDELRTRTPEAPYDDIREFYDMVHHKPLPEYEKAYLRTKEVISALGLTFI